MSNPRKSKSVRLEIRLGISIIILVLALLNVASFYTLYRVADSRDTEIREELAEAALLSAGKIRPDGEKYLEENIHNRLFLSYNLEKLEIFPLDYDRVLYLNSHGRVDTILLQSDSSLGKLENITDILYNRPIFYHDKDLNKYLHLFPMEKAGSKYLVLVVKRADILSSITKARQVLLFFSFIVGGIILAVLVRLIRNVIKPFGKLAEEVSKANPEITKDQDDIDQVIKTYEKMIAELTAKEQELRKMNELVTQKADYLEIYNNHILRSINTGIITLDKDLRLSTINPAAGNLLSIDRYEYIGIRYDSAFGSLLALKECLDTGLDHHKQTYNSEIKFAAKEDEDMRLMVSLTSLFDSFGSNIGRVIILTDQTEYIRMQEELEHNRRMAMIGEMSGGLAHQLRNSIMAIMGFARLVDKKAGENETVAKLSQNLITEGKQAESLVARFLDFARPLSLMYDKTEMSAFLNEVITAAATRYPNINITLKHESEDIFARIDPLLLKQAVGNIIDNACAAYDKNKGSVQVSIKETAENISININDNAGGIQDSDRDQIFTPFFSGYPSGSGLGLPLADKIVNLHGGRIEFETEEGKGTLFSITLPRALNLSDGEPSSHAELAG